MASAVNVTERLPSIKIKADRLMQPFPCWKMFLCLFHLEITLLSVTVKIKVMSVMKRSFVGTQFPLTLGKTEHMSCSFSGLHGTGLD